MKRNPKQVFCPPTVRIFGRTYRFVDEVGNGLGQDRLGSCDSINHVITRDLAQHELEFVDTTLHEVLHGICSTMRLGTDLATEEKFVGALATGLIGVFQDNPEFARWLIEQRPQKGDE